MKILGLTNLHPSPWFPLRGVFNKQLFEALGKTDDVRLIVPVSWTDELKTFRKKKCALEVGRRRSNLHGIEAEHPRYLFPPKLFRSCYGPCFLKSIEKTFRRAVDEFQPDVLLAAWAYPDGWAAVELGHRHGLPVVVKLHGSDLLLLSNIRGCRKRIAQCVNRADGLIAVSRDLAMKAIILGADSGRVTTVYDGVDRTLFHPGDRLKARYQLSLVGDDPIILFIGNLVAVKGIDILLDACHRLSLQGTRFHCYLVGQGPLRSQLWGRIQQLRLSDRISLVGPRPHAELPNWYRAANVFVLPSRSEGVPCVLLEAAACGTPCVASRVGGIPEIAGCGAMTLTPPGNAAALAEAITAALLGQGAVADRPVFTRTFEDTAQEVRAMLRAVVRPRLEAAVAPVSNSASVSVAR